jgi:carboxylesterase type B
MGSGNAEAGLGLGTGPGHILNRDVVFVTLNYRLGVFGK